MEDVIREFLCAVVIFIFQKYFVDSIMKYCLAWGKSTSKRNRRLKIMQERFVVASNGSEEVEMVIRRLARRFYYR